MLKILGIPTSKWTLVLLAGDIAAFFFSVVIVVLLVPFVSMPPPFFLSQHYGSLLLLLGINLLTLFISDLYDHYQDYRTELNISRLIFAVWLATLLAVVCLRWCSRSSVGRSFLEWHAVAFAGLLVLCRYVFSALALPVRLRRRALIIGTGPEGRMILEAIQARPQCGFEVAGFIGGNPHKAENAVAGVQILGSLSKLGEIVKEHQIDMVVMAKAPERSQRMLASLSRLSFSSPTIIDMPSFYEFLCGKVPIHYISETWLYMHSVIISKPYYRHLKRIIDLVIAGLSLILFLPLGVLIAATIRLDSPGPIFFRQQRLAKNNKSFAILKFRTMFHDRVEINPKWAVSRDPRVTRVGRFLRKLHLDELPQLINVWKGDMSLIGPRAEWDLFAYNALEKTIKWRPGLRGTDKPGLMVKCGFEERIPFYGFRTVVRPGITGWAQVNFSMAGSSLEELTEKLQYDLYYIKNMGFWLDFTILLKTIRIVLLGRGK